MVTPVAADEQIYRNLWLVRTVPGLTVAQRSAAVARLHAAPRPHAGDPSRGARGVPGRSHSPGVIRDDPTRRRQGLKNSDRARYLSSARDPGAGTAAVKDYSEISQSRDRVEDACLAIGAGFSVPR